MGLLPCTSTVSLKFTRSCLKQHERTLALHACKRALSVSLIPYDIRTRSLVSRRTSRSTHVASVGRGSTDFPASADFQDVDHELWEVLDMATDSELEDIHDILYGQSVFSPVIKSFAGDNEPAAIDHRGRPSLMLRIDKRFRFLATDSAGFLRGHRPSYREALGYVRDRLAIRCPNNLATPDLESEIFLHLYAQLTAEIGADGAASHSAAELRSMFGPNLRSRQRGGWQARLNPEVAAPLTVGGKELVPTLIKLGGALTVAGVRTAALRELGRQLLQRRLLYDAALAKLCEAGLATLQRRATLQAAQRGVSLATARFSATSGALGMLGPIMWAWLGTDLALKAVGTDYGRIVRAIVKLAEIRLLRTSGFVAQP